MFRTILSVAYHVTIRNQPAFGKGIDFMKCFAYTDKGCRAMLTDSCFGDNCRFCKTYEQAEADRQHSAARIASLDSEQRLYIANKYYGGRLPVPEVSI